MQSSFDVASVHEFRVPPKALLGLHSYSPVHFDVFHAVLVDLSVHIVFLKAGTNTASKKVSRFVEVSFPVNFIGIYSVLYISVFY